jgi:hypothetical protein
MCTRAVAVRVNLRTSRRVSSNSLPYLIATSLLRLIDISLPSTRVFNMGSLYRFITKPVWIVGIKLSYRRELSSAPLKHLSFRPVLSGGNET